MNVTVLASSTAFGQAIIVLVTPILTRLYQPDDFGIMAAYASVLSMLSVIAAFRYDFVIPLPEEDSDAANVIAVAFFSLLIMTVLTTLGIILLGSQISVWLQTPQLARYLWLLPVGLLAVGAYQNLNFWAIRKQQFNNLAKTRVSQNIGRALTQTAAGLLKLGPAGLIIGYVLGLSGGIGTLAKLLWQDIKPLLPGITSDRLNYVAKRYWRFPLVNSWASIISSLSQELPVLIISSYFGSTVVGWFYLSLKVLRVPFTIVGQAIAQVFYARASVASRGGDLSRVTLEVFENLNRLSMGPMLWIGLMAPSLFSFIFGSNWETSGYYSRYISPLLFILFVTTPLSTIVYVKERQRTDLIFQIFLLVGRVGVILLSGIFGNASIAILSYSLVSFVILMIYLFWLMAASENDVWLVIHNLMRELIINFLLVVPIVLTLIFDLDIYIIFIISGLSLCLMALRIVRQIKASG